MRRTLVGMVAAAAIALVPVLAMANSNQEFAEKIAASLRGSGKLQDYKIGVKFQDGTAWLRGRVTSQDQMDAAMRHVLQIPGVDRVVNNLDVAADQEAVGAPQAGQVRHPVDVVSNTTPQASGKQAARLASSFTARPVQPTAATASKPTAVRPGSRATPVSVTQNPMVAMQPAGTPMPISGGPIPQYITPASGGMPPAQYDQPNMPNYAWPSYASYPNYAALTYPKQYSPTAWPYIGPFYPYPQVPLGWRSVKLQWHDGWWQLDFDDGPRNQWFSGLFRPCQ